MTDERRRIRNLINQLEQLQADLGEVINCAYRAVEPDSGLAEFQNLRDMLEPGTDGHGNFVPFQTSNFLRAMVEDMEAEPEEAEDFRPRIKWAGPGWYKAHLENNRAMFTYAGSREQTESQVRRLHGEHVMFLLQEPAHVMVVLPNDILDQIVYE